MISAKYVQYMSFLSKTDRLRDVITAICKKKLNYYFNFFRKKESVMRILKGKTWKMLFFSFPTNSTIFPLEQGECMCAYI